WHDGTEMYSKYNEKEIDALLGITDGLIEGLSKKEDPDLAHDAWSPDGRKLLASDKAVPLRLRLHQLIGLLRMLDCMFTRRPLLVMDEVGVGKTAQAIALVATYVWYRAYFAYHDYKRFPGKFERFPDQPKSNLPEHPHLIVCPANLLEQWSGELHRWLEFGTFSILNYTGACKQ
ncbi:hypothetical protein C8T65DRAFT_524762, partial [Cerioporus squamosus]